MPSVGLIVCGVGLTFGIFTPLCGTLIAAGYGLMLFWPGNGMALPHLDWPAALVGVAAAAGLALLGPGAFSLDARLFGRRKIFIRGK